MYLCASGIDFASSYDFVIEFWNCSYSVVFLFYFLLLQSIWKKHYRNVIAFLQHFNERYDMNSCCRKYKTLTTHEKSKQLKQIIKVS